MKKYLALILAIVMSLSLVACGGGGGGTESPSGGGETQSGGQTASGGDIYVLVPNADHGWTGAVLTYAQQKAEEVNAEGNYNVIVQAATDAKNQQEQIDDLLAAATPPAGIVILPYDNTMESSMNNIAATDIPFIMVDRIIDNPVVQEKVVANVKGDNEGIGKATKRFFGVTVLDKVSFDVEEGEVHALLGENGAGKSTLMNILGGVHQRDGGTVEFCGKQMDSITVKSADEAGIAFVHQELNVINDLTVYENLFLNKEILGKFRHLNKREMIRQSQELFNRLGVDINPTEMVGNLDTSRKQLLEIAKALHAEAKLFILDEPTTALNTEEIEHLFGIVRRLKGEGKSFIFISHKMPEIFEIADRYTILRNGSFISSGRIADITPEEVTRQMVGEGYVNQEVYEARKLGEPILELEGLTGKGFHDVTLSVHKGEVLGFTGLKGAGSSELMQAVFGAIPFTAGKLKVWGKPVASGTIHKAMKDKVAMLAANRKENSVIPDMTLLENTYCAEHTLSGRHPHIHVKREVAKYNKLKQMLNIKAESHEDLIVSLSGGNQQKVILARWLNTEAEILLLDNPTQGIDVGAKTEIYKLIQELAKAGKTVIVNTLEIPEIQKVADRCVVFYHGGVQAVLERSEITEERVMLLATNASAIRAEQGQEV